MMHQSSLSKMEISTKEVIEQINADLRASYEKLTAFQIERKRIGRMQPAMNATVLDAELVKLQTRVAYHEFELTAWTPQHLTNLINKTDAVIP